MQHSWDSPASQKGLVRILSSYWLEPAESSGRFRFERMDEIRRPKELKRDISVLVEVWSQKNELPQGTGKNPP